MPKKKIDLQAQSFGEKWFERSVNYAPDLWYPIICLFFGIIFIIFDITQVSDTSKVFSYLGPLWIVLALVNFERYQARKAILRLTRGSQPKPESNINKANQITSSLKTNE